MKRNEPIWKRDAARKHCKARKQQVWDVLSGVDDFDWESSRWVRQKEFERIKHLSATIEFI